MSLQQQKIKEVESQTIFKKASDVASTYEGSIYTSVQPEELEFSFDDAAVNSTVYRRVTAQQRRRTYAGNSSSKTLINTEAFTKETKPNISIFSRFKRASLPGDNSQTQLYDDLCDAASAGDISVVQDLITRGADPSYGSTTRYWLSMGPKKNYFAFSKNQLPTPMQNAISGGHPLIVQYLWKSGVKLHRDVLQALLFNFSSPECDPWITHLLLAYARPFDAACMLPPYPTPHSTFGSDFMFATILHHLAWKADAASLGILQNMFAQGWQGDVDRRAEGYATPLHCACMGPSLDEASRLEVIGLLLDNGADASAIAHLCLDADIIDDVKWTRTPLQSACMHGLDSVVATLVAHSDGPETYANTDSLGYTALHYAAAMGNPWILQTILDGSPAVAMQSDSGSTPLHYACTVRGDSVTNVEALLCCLPLTQWPSDNNMADKPLHYAAAEGNTNIVAYLLTRGADPNVRNAKGVTPLMLAASRGHQRTITALVAGGARLETATTVGSALFYACWYGRVETVRTLLECGANVHAVNGFRFNAADLVVWLKKAHYIPVATANLGDVLELLVSMGVKKHDFEQAYGRGLERASLDLTCVPRRFGNREYIRFIMKA